MNENYSGLSTSISVFVLLFFTILINSFAFGIDTSGSVLQSTERQSNTTLLKSSTTIANGPSANIKQGSGTLLYDRFGVTLKLRSPHDGGTNHSFKWKTFKPTLNTGSADYVEADWYGNWDWSEWGDGSKTINHPSASGTPDLDYHPSGDEPYDVEALYFDNDADNFYIVVVTSFDHNGIIDPRRSSTELTAVAGDLSINLFKGSPRSERNGSQWHYNYGVNVTHENRTSGTNSVGAPHMRDNSIGNELYRTGYDAGGPDLSSWPHPSDSDWYRGNAHGHVKAYWEHTNFDPQQDFLKTSMRDYRGAVTVNYYEYDFGGKLENGYPTYVYEFTISRAYFGSDNPTSGAQVGILWSPSCRNDGNKEDPIVKLIADVENYNASIGDFVWNDINGNGIQDGGESGVENIPVVLYHSNGNQAGTTTTNSSGYYSFTKLTPGDYYVKFILPAGYAFSSKDQGSNDTKDSDAKPSTGKTIVTTLAPGENDPTWDAGIYKGAIIGDYVWHDSDKDGIQDDGESGVPNVTVKLYNGDGSLAGTATTNAAGYYKFEKVVAGDYYIKFILPSGYTFSPKDQGGDNTKDSDAKPSTGKTIVTTLSAGENDPTWDAGIYETPAAKASIGDYVWHDTNKNGIQDAGENGLPNITVKLYHSDGSSAGTTTTNASGYYSFTDLTPSDYYVEFVLPNGYTFSPKDQGGDDAKDSDADPSTGKTIVTTLSAGENDPTWDAGIYETPVTTASLGDYVWHDSNKDGIQDDSETGVPNVTVKLYHSGGSSAGTTTTNAGGQYEFTNLTPGDYYVKFILPSGYTISPKDQGSNDAKDSDAKPSTGKTIITTLSAGENDPTWDAGIYETPAAQASIGDYVWNDSDKDGIQDDGEIGVPNVTVKLYNSDGSLAGTTTTNASGYYSFTDLTPGNYYVEFILPSGYTFSPKDHGGDDVKDSDADPSTGKTIVTTLSAGENNPTWDAGIYETPVTSASLGDYVWNDTNKNGIQDAGEPGIGGVLVKLKQNGSVIDTHTTDSNGFYEFTNLPAGNYVVKIANSNFASGGVLKGWDASPVDSGSDDTKDSDGGETSHKVTVTLGAEEHNPTIDFGYYLTSDCKEPTYNDAIVDGNYGEWNLTNDFFANMYRAGNPDKDILSKLYLRYDCDTNILYALVLAENGHIINAGSNSNEHFIKMNGIKLVDASSYPPDGILPEFAWVNLSGNDAGGWEVSVSLDPGEYDNFRVHTLIDNDETSNVANSKIEICIYCTSCRSEIGDYVWWDENHNGLQDDDTIYPANAPHGINGVKVILYDGNGNYLDETLTTNGPTGGPGWYEFTDIIPTAYSSVYRVSVDPTTVPVDLIYATYDYDGIATPHTADVTLGVCEKNYNLDFGYDDEPLPVTLSSFTATSNNGQVELNWVTESEIENQGFFIERRELGDDWEEIASYLTNADLQGQGTVTYSTNYVYVDKLVQVGHNYEYRLADVDYDGVVEYHSTRTVTVEEIDLSVTPDKFAVKPAYPNPFNPSTNIEYTIPKDGRVNITIYDLTGHRVSSLVNKEQAAGWHKVRWSGNDDNGTQMPAGIYLVTVNIGNSIKTMKLVFVK